MGRSNCSLLEFDHTIPPRQRQGSVPEACSSQSVPAAPGGRLAADVASQGQRQKARRVLEASRRCVWSRGRRFAASSVPGSMAADYPRHPHASDRTTPRPWLGQRWRSSTLASLWHFPPINETRQHHITAGSWGVVACLPSRSHLASCWRCGRGQAASVPGWLTNRPALAPAPLPPALQRDDVYSVPDYHQLP